MKVISYLRARLSLISFAFSISICECRTWAFWTNSSRTSLINQTLIIYSCEKNSRSNRPALAHSKIEISTKPAYFSIMSKVTLFSKKDFSNEFLSSSTSTLTL